MEEYSGSNRLVIYGQIPPKDNIDDVIKLYMPKKRERNRRRFSFCFRICRFFLMVFAFFLVYYCLYQLYLKNAMVREDIPASASPIETHAEETVDKSEFRLPLVINESEATINIEEYFKDEVPIKLPQGKGVKVIIVNSHSSENASSSLSVSDLAKDLALILESRGVGTYFDDTDNDANGALGAYSRMSDNVVRLQDIYNEAVVLIDLHNSDSGMPVTFTIGCREAFAWQENLRFTCSIYKLMKDSDTAFRFLPSSLGQDNGLLTVNIGIGGNQCDDSEARRLLSSFADALLQLFDNEPLAAARGSLLCYRVFSSARDIPVLEMTKAIISSSAECSPDVRILVAPVS